MFSNDLQDQDAKRHWCAHCEKYCGGDTLLIALEDGWIAKGVIFRQTFWLQHKRQINVFHITLQRSQRLIQLSVIDNPFVNRLLQQMDCQVVQLNELYVASRDRARTTHGKNMLLDHSHLRSAGK
jgi:hypothetical protein